MLWAFLHSFSELLGLWPSTVDELLAALAAGESSRLLGEVHVGLLRLLQADMEEAHASGAGQACTLLLSCVLFEMQAKSWVGRAWASTCTSVDTRARV